MIAISGYQFGELIHESATSLIYRGRRRADNASIILKVLKEIHPSPEQIARIKREYEILQSLEIRGAVKAYALEKNQQRWVLILEDFGGQSLAQLNLAGRLSLSNFLVLASRTTRILGQIHQQHVIHKDINPSNIVVLPFDPETKDLSQHIQWPVKLIDFGISTVLSQENSTINQTVLQGTLAYISPEQTGRMNRAVDYRTDFYSLGATFYELLTGQLPFQSNDSLELVHSHIAKEPVPLQEINVDIPPVVSDIVMKLMSKNAEDRYQSAYGLKADLEECLRQWQALQRIEAFPIGQQDISDKLQIPQKLYGREEEIEALLATFKQVGERTSEMTLVNGHIGIGKSALVHDLYKPITAQRGYFITGKFDQLQRNVPYVPFIGAFRSLVQELLTENEAKIATWKEKLLAAFGPNGQIIIDVIPEIELIVGAQPQVPALGPVEAQNRFNLVFQHFINVFATPEHALVIFLDDLPWADKASLELIKLLMTAPNSNHLFLIGAYRDNEIDDHHPLLSIQDEIETAGINVNQVRLSPLKLPHVTQWVIDTFHCWPEQATPLAELMMEKTGGNPYFMGEFLKSLYAEKLISFDSWRGTWQWDLAQLRTQEITDNVVELMAEKVQKLPPETQKLLRLAACIGHQFDLETLSIISQKSADDIAADLWAAISEGLILLLSRQYQFSETDIDGVVTAEYKFSHDRVQQAVYSLISETSKQALHWRVGQLLLRHTLPDKREERIFDLVNQLNLGRAACVEQAEWDELANLNLRAGQKAKASAAYQLALSYFNIGIELIQLSQSPLLKGGEETNCWQRQYNLTLSLYVEATEAAYLVTDFELMDQFVGIVIQQAETLLDKIKVYEVQMLAYITQGKLQHVINTTLPLLTMLAIRLPTDPSEADTALSLQVLETALAEKKVEDLITLPEMTDPYRLAAMHILSIVSSVATVANPKLLPLLVFKMVTLSVNHGNAPESAPAYADYGLILCGQIGDIVSGSQFGQLALDVVKRLEAQECKARTLFAVNTFISHWQTHVREGLHALLEAYQSGLEIGDLNYAARSIFIYNIHSFYAGQELKKLEREMATYGEAMAQLKQERILYINELYREMVLNLMGKIDLPYQLSTDSDDAERTLSSKHEAQAKNVSFNIYANKLILYYLFHNYQYAVECAAIAEKHLDSVAASFSVPIFYFYDSLAHLALLLENSKESSKETPDQGDIDQEYILEKVAANQQKLKKWAQYAPMNHLHKYHLVEAECARVLGKDGPAREHYDQAIASAQENQYINEEALADELAAGFYLAKGQTEIANVYLQKSHYAYLRWGAQAKVEDLETRHPQLKAQSRSSLINTGTTTTSVTPSIQSTQDEFGILDFTSVIKASQVLSSEIMLDSLLSRMMRLVIENAGAQKGYLLLEKNDEWSIEAASAADQDDVPGIHSIPLTVAAYGRRPIVPGAIINYVIRSQKNVVLNEVTRVGQYTRDPYIVATQPKSVLCAPLLSQGKLIGVIYLENNLTTGAFTSGRLEVLNLLSAQAAISIENARFYAHQIELTRAYSRFVPREILYFLRKTSITQLKLGDQIQQEMTVLFSDIRSFTNLSEQMTPQENFNFINAYLRRVSPRIREYNGFIDKYMGDAIMALFPTNANDAVQAAIAMQQEVVRYNAHREKDGHEPIKIGLGLHTGMVMLGTIGEAERMEATVISDAVNLAARLEGLTKFYGSSIIVSGEMMFSLDSPDRRNFRFLDKVKVKGKDEAVSIFEILEGDPEDVMELKLKTLDDFEHGMLHYHSQEFEEAKKYFQKTLAVNPEDQAGQLYLKRIQQFIEYGVPVDWEGITTLTEK